MKAISVVEEVAEGRAHVSWSTVKSEYKGKTLLVYVFRDAAGFARFRPSPGISGFMLPRAQRNFLVIHAGKETDARVAALHEYVHFVHRNGTALK